VPVAVISAAHVVNGLLLPFVVICLLLTLNDPCSMLALPSVPSTIASKSANSKLVQWPGGSKSVCGKASGSLV
jgi:Mn2+/Fe2+ NRAMP family transporter